MGLTQAADKLGGRYTMYQVSGDSISFAGAENIGKLPSVQSYHFKKFLYRDRSSFAPVIQFLFKLADRLGWVPSTSRMRPMHSRQVAGGVYMELPWRLRLEVESYFRTTSRMLEYEAGGSLTHCLRETGNRWYRWETANRMGLETSLVYHDEQNLFQAGYTLSWSNKNLMNFYSGWYPSKFDNRHKLNFVYRRKFSHRMDV